MNFTDTFIRRPVLAMVISLLLVVLGLRAAGSPPPLRSRRRSLPQSELSIFHYS
mgnify:CR=1 FL=1